MLLLAAALMMATPLAAQEASPASASDPAPGPIVVITGPAAPDGRLCLAVGEVAVLASDRITFELVGKACHELAVAEQQAFTAEQEIILTQALFDAEAAHAAARESGIEADIERTGRALADARSQLLRMFPPRFYFDGPASPSPQARPLVFRLAAASPSVHDRMKRGAVITRTTVLCLKSGEQATINGSNGQSVTYTGPGCMRRNARPDRDNIGAFTFG
jgi:hypothetical protein